LDRIQFSFSYLGAKYLQANFAFVFSLLCDTILQKAGRENKQMNEGKK